MTRYHRGWTEVASGTAFSNLPPMPNGVAVPGADQKDKKRTWPHWLHQLEADSKAGTPRAAEAFAAAFDPNQWNWQLAWLDPVYRTKMPAGKYNRGSLSLPPPPPGGGGRRSCAVVCQSGSRWTHGRERLDVRRYPASGRRKTGPGRSCLEYVLPEPGMGANQSRHGNGFHS